MYHTNKKNEMEENVFFLKIVNYFNAVCYYLFLESAWIYQLSHNTKAQSLKIGAVLTVVIMGGVLFTSRSCLFGFTISLDKDE